MITLLLAWQVLPASFHQSINWIVAFANSTGASISDRAVRRVVRQTGTHTQVEVVDHAGRAINVWFGEGGQVDQVTFSGAVGPGVVPSAPLRQSSVQLLRNLGWLQDHEQYTAVASPTTPGRLSVWRRVGPYKAYGAASFTFRGGMFHRLTLPSRMTNLQNLQDSCLPTHELVAKALGYYHAYRPMVEASYQVSERYFGLPLQSIDGPAPSHSARLAGDIEAKRGIPFVIVSLSAVGNERQPSHIVFVDARTGELYTYFSGGSLGGESRTQPVEPPTLNQVTIGKVTGHLNRTQASQEEQPKGPTCLVRSGKSVFLAPLDSEGRLWLKIGNRPWRAYRPDPKLLKAARASALLRRPSERTR